MSFRCITLSALLVAACFLPAVVADAQQAESSSAAGVLVRVDDSALTTVADEFGSSIIATSNGDAPPRPPENYASFSHGGENDSYFQGQPLIEGDCACCGGCDFWGWTLLPEGIIYRSYLAGVNESRLGLRINHIADNDDDEGAFFDGTLGGRKGIIRYGNRDAFRPEGFQLDIEAAAHVRLSFQEDMDVQATDYRVGVPFTYGWCNKQIKFGYWHVSSHLGDEFILRNAPNFTRFNYAKDSLVLGYSEYVTDDFRIYAEASWAFWSDIAEPWEFQFGFEKAPRCPTGFCGAPFYAVNGHLRQELDFGGNFVAQAGWAWRADEGGGLLRVGVHYYNGRSSQRSFWNQHEKQIGIGIWYDN